MVCQGGLDLGREPWFNPRIMAATKTQYELLMQIRPYKFDTGDVEYRKAEKDQPQCGGCIHFHSRIDGYNVCEIYRDADNEESIRPDWTCRFQTEDGEKFPLLGDE